jgi:imidazolonepropionase
MWDRLFTNLTLASMAGREPYGLVENAAVAVKDGLVAFAGPMAALPGEGALQTTDAGGALMTPGLIDCHTHLVYAGDRAAEFEARLLGKSYEEIARAGGGILSTVRATRAASEDDLVEAALPRMDAMIAEGVTAVEIKSGYGLTLEDELKMLRAARRLGRARPVRVMTTLLAAHALPPEFAARPDAYIDHVCEEIMPAAAAENLADAVDGFCETIGFTPAQIERVFDKASALGLRVKLHAEQLSDLKGAALAARHGALSADHLEFLAPEDAKILAEAGTVAVLLPGAFYFLRETKLPPIDALRASCAKIALATDCNPGTSPMTSLLLAMNMGCTLFRLTPEEALAGVTRNAAAALGLEDAGVIAPGKRADLCLWRARHPAELSYGIGRNALAERVFAG